MTGDDPKPPISAEEMQRRRVHVRVAIAENRIEGIPISRTAQEICDLYIRGEIEARDLVAAYNALNSSRRATTKILCPRAPSNRSAGKV